MVNLIFGVGDLKSIPPRQPKVLHDACPRLNPHSYPCACRHHKDNPSKREPRKWPSDDESPPIMSEIGVSRDRFARHPYLLSCNNPCEICKSPGRPPSGLIYAFAPLVHRKLSRKRKLCV